MGKKFVNSFKKTIFTFDLHRTVTTPICIIRNTFSK